MESLTREKDFDSMSKNHRDHNQQKQKQTQRQTRHYPSAPHGEDEIDFQDPSESEAWFPSNINAVKKHNNNSNHKDDDPVIDETDDEVLRLAERLAPAFEDAYDLFQVPAEFRREPASSKSHNGDEFHDSDGLLQHGEDDDLKREISDLERSEELLREEMEQANLFSKLVTSPMSDYWSFSFQNDEGEDDETEQIPPQTPEPDQLPAVSEADIVSADLEAPEQNLRLPPIDVDKHVINQTPSASNKKQRQKMEQQQHQKQQQQQTTEPPTTPIRPNRGRTTLSSPFSTPAPPSPPPNPVVAMGRTPLSYNLKDHQEHIGMVIENGWYVLDMGRYLLPSSLRNLPSSITLPTMYDYCISCPENRLKNWYIGFVETSNNKDKNKKNNNHHHRHAATYTLSPLPVRTTVIRIRPDVLCGAVMDAVVTATTTLVDTEPNKIRDYTILRRQGGHVQLVLTSTMEGLQFMVDLQLCTHKSNACPRSLIVRIFRYQDAPGANQEPSSHQQPQQPNINSTAPREVEDPREPQHKQQQAPEACLHLREACALVQRMEIETSNASSAPRQQIKFRPAQSPSMSDRDAIAHSLGKHLRRNYKACPSTTEGNITLPALNNNDWKLLTASWVWSAAIWDELESRTLTYSSLASIRFGTFPCLRTLDAHYCSQIRRYSRDAMIVQLLKYATHLEEYARDSEYACANVIALLRQAFIEYGVDPPPLPVAIPLTSYPLEHASPQSICPPWGLKVMEALHHIQANVDKVGMKNSFDEQLQGDDLHTFIRESTEFAAQSVASVVEAFQKQDDEEKGARLQRKNRQVMERLAVMKKHQLTSVELLDQCTADSAQKSADELFAKAKIREVPLLKCGVVAGSNTGTCIVTARHIIFITQFVPLLWGMGQNVHVFQLKDVDFDLEENSPVFLTALPTIISLEQNGQVVFTFRPSTGGVRIKNFLDIIKSIACENKSVLSS